MAATIKIKNSSTASAVPTSSDLVQGELAVNVTDKRLFTENSGGTVVELGTNPSILTLPDGSASAPTLTNDGDTNTGIFFPAADTVGITTGGTERARVDSSGNLGVGTTSPGAKLSLTSTGNTTADGVRLTFGSEARAHNIYSDLSTGRDLLVAPYRALTLQAGSGTTEGELRLKSYESTIFYTGSAYSERMRLDASGNLGVGTTTMTRNLNVGGSNAAVGLNLQNSGTSGRSYSIFSTNSSASIAGALSFYDDTAGAYRMVIDSSGNLLVGKTSENTTTVGIQARADGLFSAMKNDAVSGIFARGASNGDVITFRRDSTAVGSISVTTTATAYNTSSDYRLKDVTGSLTGYKERLLALEPKQGSWKVDGSEFRGFLAHEFANSYPSSVNGEKDAVDDEGKPQYQGMQAGSPEVIADLVAYIKELENRLSALEQA